MNILPSIFSLQVVFIWCVLFCSCKKPIDVVNNNGQPPISSSLSGPVSLLLTDYYPDSFYHRYAVVDVTSDSINVKFHIVTLNSFSLKTIKIVIGSFEHIKGTISFFTTPPLNEVG